MSTMRTNKPELLAPAGDWDCLRAAVENGADAVYFGLQSGFNARARAVNFTLAELPAMMRLLHSRCVRGYVTLNTLAFTSELPAIEETARSLAAAGVDAVLVQDLGVMRLVRAICPEMAVHASTQMTITSAESLRVAEELGAERVVLARELAIDEIAKIGRQTQLPLEAFVHGALCVAYSGQCLTSESLGGRSANRGQCAQACRLPYELVCDGKDVELGAQKYLLSPQDLAAFELVPELIAAGVQSLKIEGRLKTPEYVANMTSHYRRAIDEAVAGRAIEFAPQDVAEMELSFSRGFSPGWLRGCDHKMLVPGTSSAKRGVLAGEVRGIRGRRIVVAARTALKPGDGVVLEGDRTAGTEMGGRLYEVFPLKPGGTGEPLVELGFAAEAIDLDRVQVGQKLWKTDDPELTGRLRKTFTGKRALRRVPLDVAIEATVGRPLVVSARAANGAEARVETEGPLAEAVKHALDETLLREQLGRLGETIFELRDVAATIEGRPMVPLSVLGKLRRAMIERLEATAGREPPRSIAPPGVLDRLRPKVERDAQLESLPPVLHVLCRSLAQLDSVLAHGERNIYVDFQDIREYRQAVAVAHEAGAGIWLATPRIQKPDEVGIFRVLLRHGADGLLVRNLAGLAHGVAAGVPCVADFSLNAANELTAAILMERGARRITMSYDLNRDQALDLVGAVPPAWLEVVVHQHMPMFHMEHCVFCAMLSPGTNKTNCGRPCDTHAVRLRDRVGMEHPLVADVGCRNTLFNAVPQSAAEIVPALVERGVRHLRIELLHDEPRDEIGRTIDLYRELIAGRLKGRDVWTKLRADNRLGVTRGTLDTRRDPLAII